MTTPRDTTPAAPARGALAVRGLTAGYGSLTVLREVTLEVAAGQVVCLVGANGAGKSTLMRTVAGVLPAAAGTVTLDGADITTEPTAGRIRRGLVLVPEGRHLFPSLTVWQNLSAALLPLRLPAPARRARIQEVQELFGVLADRSAQPAGTLSGGEQQMLAIARAMVVRPRLLLLDEPTTGLAPALVDTVFAKVAELAATGISVLLVEQNAQALTVADRGYLLRTGRVVKSGSAAELTADPDVERTYLGL